MHQDKPEWVTTVVLASGVASTRSLHWTFVFLYIKWGWYPFLSAGLFHCSRVVSFPLSSNRDINTNPPVSLHEKAAFWPVQVTLRITMAEETAGWLFFGPGNAQANWGRTMAESWGPFTYFVGRGGDALGLFQLCGAHTSLTFPFHLGALATSVVLTTLAEFGTGTTHLCSCSSPGYVFFPVRCEASCGRRMWQWYGFQGSPSLLFHSILCLFL